MATWDFYSWLSGNDTSDAAGLWLDSSSALSFGGGASTEFQTNISLNTWNSAMHYAEDTASTSVDMCPAPHLHATYPTDTFGVSTDTGAVVDGAYVNMATGTPDPARGIGLRFTHGFAVSCTPVTVWAGQGPVAANYPVNCDIAMASLTSVNPTWDTATPNDKLALEGQPSNAQHWWNIAISLRPTVVGHNGQNKMMVDVTYY